MRATCAAVFLVALALAPAPARAQAAADDAQVAEAKRFFEAGRQAYEAGQYLVAATAFEAAYRLAPRPPVAFSMAQAYRRQFFADRDPAKLKRAVDLYKRYIVDVPQGGRRGDALQYVEDLEPMLLRIEDEQRKQGMGPVKATEPPARDATQLMISSRTRGARARLDGAAAIEVPLIREVQPGKHKVQVEAPGHFGEEVEGVAVEGRLVVVEVNLREQPARLVVHAPDGAEIAIDGRPVGLVPLPRPLDVPAGKHFLSVTRRGHHPFTRELRLQRGEQLSVDAPLEWTGQRAASYWVMGAAGLAFLAGATTSTMAYVAQGKAQDVLDHKAAGQITQAELDEYNRQRGRRDDLASASYVLYGGAVALAATGALMYWVDTPRVGMPGIVGNEPLTPDDQQPSFAPALGPGGMMGAVLRGRF